MSQRSVSLNYRIGLRFLFSRKRSMLMSLAGIVFGIGFFIITQAQTSGFESFFIRTMLGVNGMLRVEDRLQDTLRSMSVGEDEKFALSMEGKKYISGIEHPNRIMDAILEFESVTGVSPVMRDNATMHANFNEESCEPYGIKIDRHLSVSDLDTQIRYGSIQAFRSNPQSVLVGIKLAERLDIQAGDTVRIEKQNQNLNYQVAAIYETGIEQVDKERVFIHLSAARTLFERPFGVSYIQVNTKDPADAPALAARLRAVLNHHVMSWQKRERTWLEVFRALRVSSAITVSSIILISGLGMFNTLVMIVMEKTRDIAILRSMGYTRKDITQIFLFQGSTVLALGILLGWAFAAAATYGISRLPIRIRGIFSTDHFVVEWSIAHYLTAAVVATVIVLIASLIPARRAARLEPGDIIRGTGG